MSGHLNYVTASTKFKVLWNEILMMKYKAISIQSAELAGNDTAKLTMQYFDLTDFMGEWRC